MTHGTLKLIVALDGAVGRETVEDALRGGASFEVARLASGLEEGRAALRGPGDVVVVGCDGDSATAAELVADAVGARADRPVVVLCAHEPNGVLQQMFEAGADDVLVLPERPERIAFALEKAVTRREGSGEPSRLIAVLGPKGGTGKTVVATNLAVALARSGTRTALVDVDLQFGDVALSLGLEPRTTLFELAHSGGTLDAEKVEGFLLAHESGLRVLAAPLRPDNAAAVSVDLLTRTYAALRELVDVVVVDTPSGFPPEVIGAIDAASDLCLVGTLDASSLKDSRLGLEMLALMGCDDGRCRIVLNRAGSAVGIENGDVERILGRRPDLLVPSDRAVPRAVNGGLPVVVASPRSPAGRALASLAASYAHGAPVPVAPERRGLHLLAGRA